MHGEVGTTVSLIPYGSVARNVKSAGLKYPLVGSDLTLGTRGISNEMCEPEASLSVDEGILLVYIEPSKANCDNA